MNAYWINELIHETATCNPWIAGMLIGLVAVFAIATVVTIVKLNK